LAFAWSVLLAFVRLTTNPKVLEEPYPVAHALHVVDSWLAQPSTTVVGRTERHAGGLGELLDPVGVGGNLVSDVHLGAIAIEHGATRRTADRDFGRFSGLKWMNALAG